MAGHQNLLVPMQMAFCVLLPSVNSRSSTFLMLMHGQHLAGLPASSTACKGGGHNGKLLHRIEQPAWVLTLGQDRLLQQVRGSASQAALCIAMAGGQWHSYTDPQPISHQTAAESAASTFAQLGSSFCHISFAHHQRRSRGGQFCRLALQMTRLCLAA